MSSRTKPPLSATDPRHGTYNGYTNWRCRCGPCKGAAAERVQTSSSSAVNREATAKAKGILCSVNGCDHGQWHTGLRLCHMHHARLHRTGSTSSSMGDSECVNCGVGFRSVIDLKRERCRPCLDNFERWGADVKWGTEAWFWHHVDKSDPQGHWRWTRAEVKRTEKSWRIPSATVNGQRLTIVHQAWILTTGNKAKTLGRDCGNGWCINPDHMTEDLGLVRGRGRRFVE